VTVPVEGLGPGGVTGWGAYPAGVAWALRAAGHEVAGANLAIDSDLPQGAGLSSSAALECAVALALTGLYGLAVPRPELAAIARRAENEMAGVPSGIMDQSASLLAEAGHALSLDCRSGQTWAVPFDPAAAGLTLLVVDTRARHALTDGRYAQRRRECDQAARLLGVRSLRDVPHAGALAASAGAIKAEVTRRGDMTTGTSGSAVAADAGVGPARTGGIADVAAGAEVAAGAGGAAGAAAAMLMRRARHIVTDNQRVLTAAARLRNGDVAGIGPLLDASHASLRDDFEVSWPQADAAVRAAGQAGALGARMVGGGFGGSIIALVPVSRDRPVREAVCAEYERQGWAPPRFLVAPPSAGARRVR
jgi:galactokinase